MPFIEYAYTSMFNKSNAGMQFSAKWVDAYGEHTWSEDT